MALVCPDSGESNILKLIVNIARSNTDHPVLHLFTNDFDPESGSHGASGEDFDESDLTEASATGYAASTLTGSNWTIDQASGTTAAVYNSTITFSVTDAMTAYGIYVTNTAGQIMWAERFPAAPYTLPSGGGNISVLPKLELR